MREVRHRLASGDVSSCWEYDPSRRVVDCVVRVNDLVSIGLTIEVCAVDRPYFGAHPIMRLDGDSWRVLPVRWNGAFVDAPLHASLGHEQIVLTHAPADVDAELEEL